MNNWSAPQRPNIYAEQLLLSAILDGTYPPDSSLPGERTLAAEMGVTRPTLREAIQRLSRDGWLTVQQGKSTIVNDYWREGGLNVLNTLIQHGRYLPAGFVTHLLEVRLQLAPAYTYAAINNDPQTIAEFLDGRLSLTDDVYSYADFDWRLHHQLTYSSGNPIYTLILNGFGDFYEKLARIYFAPTEARARSLAFYSALRQAALEEDAQSAERISYETMLASIELWMDIRGQFDPLERIEDSGIIREA
ncbi:MAG: fatty acid metabolism transcriptional regulator FadR [Candidatus Promineifilaceae bacterium]|jgi:GntR family negative regulator for fad regulon and positive regulator of fabA